VETKCEYRNNEGCVRTSLTGYVFIGYPPKISGVKIMGTNNKVLHTTRKLLIEVSDESELQHIYLMVFALVTLGFLYFTALARTFLCLFHQDP
jgi:hypothetical protein